MTSSTESPPYDLAVVGAGPAGMMASVRASDCGAKVVLLEKNHAPGIKLLLTGKERCNITNAQQDIRAFADSFGNNGKFLLNALSCFGIRETIDFFHENNLKTVVERGGRIFPESDRARDVQELFIRRIKKSTITLITGCEVKKLSRKDAFIDKIILADTREIRAAQYLITTGGMSYPRTGSTGDGYRWARELGHKVVHPEPALCPLVVKEPWVRELEGLSLKNVRVSVYQNNKKKDERFGEALFTAKGMSGPIILDMSRSVGELLKRGQTALFIDFKPALDEALLDRRILRDLEKHRNRAVINILPDLLPRRLVPVMLNLAAIDPGKKGHSVTKEERKKLRRLLKQFPLAVQRLAGFNKAIITTGGISLKEIDPKTMRSRIIHNLFFAGEILDLDGPTGGYNLQVCWSTGYVAGEEAARSALFFL